MDLVPPPGQTPHGREDTLAGADGAPDCRRSRCNRTVRFARPDYPVYPDLSMSFRLLFISCVSTFCRLRWGIDYFKHVKHEGGNSSNNRSDLDKGNILKSTFDTLTEEGRKAFKAYHANCEEFFLSRCKVVRHGTVLKDTTPIVLIKPEVITEVPSHNDIQSMINSVLER
jgi:hypothetical protein